MKIAICEDELVFMQELKNKVEAFFCEKDIKCEFYCFDNGKSLIESLHNEYDVIFLDINLSNNEDGMDVAVVLSEMNNPAPVIFVTSLESRAVDGYDVDAYGFVIKKQLDEKLPKVLNKLWKELFCRQSIAILTKDSTEIVELDRIISAQSHGRSTLVHTENADFEDTRPIGKFVQLLGHEFVETHKSVYVNIKKIKRINTDTVTMYDETTIPLSRRNRKNVMFVVMKRIGEA